MGTPAAVAGDRITATCAGHQIPGPPTGNPIPGPPMPFSAPVTNGVSSTVLIGGKPAVVAGCSGVNSPSHVGLHASDPYMAGPAQMGNVVAGSPSVMVEGRPLARSGSTCTVCLGQPGQLVGTATTVLVA